MKEDRLERQRNIAYYITMIPVAAGALLMVLLTVLFVLSQPANATTKPKPVPAQNQAQEQGQAQGQLQGQGQAQGQQQLTTVDTAGGASASTSDATGGTSDATSSVTITGATPENDITLRNTPNVAVGGLFPANPCHMPWNAGGSVAGFGLGGGKVEVDEVCQRLEWARVAYAMGLRDAALYSICGMEQAEGNPYCNNATEWQDYHDNLATVERDNQILEMQLADEQKRARQLEGENQRFRRAEEERRLVEALSK